MLSAPHINPGLHTHTFRCITETIITVLNRHDNQLPHSSYFVPGCLSSFCSSAARQPATLINVNVFLALLLHYGTLHHAAVLGTHIAYTTTSA